MNKKWEGSKYKATCCNSTLQSKYSGQYVSCKCGKVAIDETPHYIRTIGNSDLLEILLDKVQDVVIYSDNEE